MNPTPLDSYVTLAYLFCGITVVAAIGYAWLQSRAVMRATRRLESRLEHES
jgi:hypothetical protein